jgi:hypothetical protein
LLPLFEQSLAGRLVDRIRADHATNRRRIMIIYYGGRQDFVDELARTGFAYRQLYSKRPSQR